jgi:hypothetical protein
MKRELVIFCVATVVGAGIGVAILLQLRPAPSPAPSVVRTDTLWMEKARPKLEHPTLGQRLTTTRIRGQTTIADAPSAPAQLAVRRYCEPVIKSPAVDILGDSQPRASDEGANQLHTALLPDFGGKKAGPRLELFSTLNNAHRWQWSGTVRGRVQWQSSGDTVLVTGDRLWVRLLRGIPKCAPKMAAHGLVGGLLDQDNRLEGAAINASVAALGCLF